jgi:hypothetical protein
VGPPFPVFVPQVDANGSDLGGVRLPELEVPIATYTGWNLRDAKIGFPNDRASFLGSDLPFPATKAEAQANHDQREAIAQRYSSLAEYLKKFRTAAQRLATDRFLLPEGIDALVGRGGKEWDWATAAPGKKIE